MKPKQYIKGFVEWYKQSLKNSQNIPIQYQRGFCEFYKLKLKVTPDVLIPRPETELLVDEVLSFARLNLAKLKKLIIFDMGTGSGNIAIALAKNLSLHLRGGKLTIIATDISEKALKVARRNAKLHGVSGSIEFIQSDLLSAFPLSPFPFPLIIVTNLPYIPSARIPTLDSSVKDFEPHIALDGGENGFELYEKLFTQIKEKGLKPDLLVGEIDYTQEELAVSTAKKYFPEIEIEVKKDLAKMPRILSIKKAI